MLTKANDTSFTFPRRVSFDLTHNKIHVLPTLEECRDAAKQCRREEWQRKSLNEDMLSEDIIVEIQEDCYASSRNTDSEEEKELEPISEPKSCLKKPPTVVTVTDHDNKKKKSATKKNQKKRKRSNSKSEVGNANMISVH